MQKEDISPVNLHSFPAGILPDFERQRSEK
jgi:hypothetical protein